VRKPADYFTLAPGELEMFHLAIGMVPGYYYHFRVGVPYTYQSEESVAWSGDEYIAAIPLKADVWLADLRNDDNRSVAHVGNLQEYEETMEQRSEGPFMTPRPKLEQMQEDPFMLPNPKYTSDEAAEAIERQNHEVREYVYPRTPPQEIDRAGE
jgi:hypothetical protein